MQMLKDRLRGFIKERGWGAQHTPQNLAKSICIEAAELLEHFQWDDISKPEEEIEIAYELADVIVYCITFALIANLDIATIFTEKLEIASKKFPAELFLTSTDGRSDYRRIKKEYRQKNAAKKDVDGAA
ncbi:nucleotide pyrophosphohydrolase [Patescibacteria group bacterium]|nr:nucleotide pyrophosphohydrolase [Patescibacteria group bacterium]